jgi:FkbM family methyltransferase
VTERLIARIGQKLDAAGLRPLVATAASLAYGIRSKGKQRFTVDPEGRWVNQQPEATIVSPSIHTTRYKAYREWVLDNWAWQYRPQPGDTVVDVGAGVGEEAVVLSKLVSPGGRVISIEAHPETFACLKQTIAKSGANAVTPLLCAAVADDGVASIDEGDVHLANSVMTGSGTIQIPARSLDSIADELDLQEVALVKMNIEGAERLAIQGMARLIRRTRHVAISCHDFISDRDGSDTFRTFEEVRAFLEKAGFDIATRSEHPAPWVRYYLYGTNRSPG